MHLSEKKNKNKGEIVIKKQARALRINGILKELYPLAACALRYEEDPWKLLVLGRLSAQCTDKRVNEIAVSLFDAFPTAKDMANADVKDIEKQIFSCGLYKTKAQNLKDFSTLLITEYNGIVPDRMEALLTFPGVGRKIANLILGDVYHIPSIVAETHCTRIANRLGLTRKADALITEKELKELIPPDDQTDFCHRIVLFGRDICTARSPKCDSCPIAKENLCPFYKKANPSRKKDK